MSRKTLVKEYTLYFHCSRRNLKAEYEAGDQIFELHMIAFQKIYHNAEQVLRLVISIQGVSNPGPSRVNEPYPEAQSDKTATIATDISVLYEAGL